MIIYCLHVVADSTSAKLIKNSSHKHSLSFGKGKLKMIFNDFLCVSQNGKSSKAVSTLLQLTCTPIRSSFIVSPITDEDSFIKLLLLKGMICLVLDINNMCVDISCHIQVCKRRASHG